jgi:hypothetical protein
LGGGLGQAFMTSGVSVPLATTAVPVATAGFASAFFTAISISFDSFMRLRSQSVASSSIGQAGQTRVTRLRTIHRRTPGNGRRTTLPLDAPWARALPVNRWLFSDANAALVSGQSWRRTPLQLLRSAPAAKAAP